MDEEKEYSTGRQGGPVRPSMVIMTSKLLNVSEGIAAMNVRIAIGVFLCLLLIVATFIVNVLAFDYAKDNEMNDGALVDKSTGRMVEVVAKTRLQEGRTEVELDGQYLAAQKSVAVTYGDNHMFYLNMDGFSILACPSTVSAELRTKYCQNDLTHLGYAVEGMVVVFFQDGAGVSTFIMAPEDKGFVTAAVSETMEQEVNAQQPTRKLLHLLHGNCHTNYVTGNVCDYREECTFDGGEPVCEQVPFNCRNTFVGHSTACATLPPTYAPAGNAPAGFNLGEMGDEVNFGGK